MYSPTLGRWIQNDPIAFAAGDPDLYRMEGNDPVNMVDPSGLEAEPGAACKSKATAAKNTINTMIDKLKHNDEKKARLKDKVGRLIDAAQFDWHRPTGALGYCNEWVDEYYPKVRDTLPELPPDGIKVHRVGWTTGTFTGHNVVRVTVTDDDAAGPNPNKSFRFYLDDGLVGGQDHVFVDSEADARWPKRTEKSAHLLTQDALLGDMNLMPPIGPGQPRQPTDGKQIGPDGMSLDGSRLYHPRP